MQTPPVNDILELLTTRYEEALDLRDEVLAMNAKAYAMACDAAAWAQMDLESYQKGAGVSAYRTWKARQDA